MSIITINNKDGFRLIGNQQMYGHVASNEIYAPNYRDGENVVLIRYPHGGIFEIPELIVNNKFAEKVK